MAPRIVPRSKAATFFAYAYLLRVQLAISLTMFVLPILALGQWATPRSLLENLFVLTPRGVFLSTFAAMLVAWSVLLTSRLVLLNGYDRFGVEQWWTENTLSLKPAVVASLLAAPLIWKELIAWQQLHRADELRPTYTLLVAIAAGIVFAYLTAFAALLLAVALAPDGTQGAAQTFPAPGLFRKLLAAANRRRWLPTLIADGMKWISLHLPADLCDGYIDQRKTFGDMPNPGYQLPWSGHFLAFTFALATFAVYYLIGSYRTSHVGDPTWIPALTFLLLLLLIVNWIAAFLTFFFDRFRIPIVLPALVIALLSSRWNADHLFETVAGGAAAPIHPSTVVAARVSQVPAPIVVIATAGGGIQAAAWTAKVLTGLQRESLGWPAVRFSSRITLVSAVSGGAVGSMFFLNEYKDDPLEPGFSRATDQSLNVIVEHAEAPGLDDVGWSLVYNDVPRLFSPRRASDPLLDRGRVLEMYWRRQASVNGKLSDWRPGVAEGWRPAVIFNATIAETGEPLLFSTTDLPDQTGTNRNGKQVLPVRKAFRQMYPDLDVPLATAVRLASSFPYVSPAARAAGSTRNDHIIDGGYYDNYGIASAIDWIDEAVRRYPKGREFPPVLFILIKSFPNDPMTAAKIRGWFFQSYAPILGFFNVRTTTQLVRDRFELLQLRDRLSGSDGLSRLRFATFQFPEDGAPLSWKMNGRQIDAIDNQWKKLLAAAAGGLPEGDDLLQVRCTLVGAAVSPRCGVIAGKDPW